MKRQIVEGWALSPIGDATVIWVAHTPSWREPLVVYEELHMAAATPREVTQAVIVTRRRYRVAPEVSVMVNQGAETLGLLDGYAQAGAYISPTPKGYTEAMGVTRATSMLRRVLPPECGKYAGSRRIRVHKSCRRLLAGLEAVRWLDNKPVLEGGEADAVRALAAVMAVIPPEPEANEDKAQRDGERLRPSPKKLDDEALGLNDETLDERHERWLDEAASL